jgi:hypothetical protein
MPRWESRWQMGSQSSPARLMSRTALQTFALAIKASASGTLRAVRTVAPKSLSKSIISRATMGSSSTTRTISPLRSGQSTKPLFSGQRLADYAHAAKSHHCNGHQRNIHVRRWMQLDLHRQRSRASHAPQIRINLRPQDLGINKIKNTSAAILCAIADKDSTPVEQNPLVGSAGRKRSPLG